MRLARPHSYGLLSFPPLRLWAPAQLISAAALCAAPTLALKFDVVSAGSQGALLRAVAPFVALATNGASSGTFLSSLFHTPLWAPNREYTKRRRVRSIFADFAVSAPTVSAAAVGGRAPACVQASETASLLWFNLNFCFVPCVTPTERGCSLSTSPSQYLDRGFFFPYFVENTTFPWKSPVGAYPEAQPWSFTRLGSVISGARGGEGRGSFFASRAFPSLSTRAPLTGVSSASVSSFKSAPILRSSAVTPPLSHNLLSAMPRAFILKRRLRPLAFRSRAGYARLAKNYFPLSGFMRSVRPHSSRRSFFRLVTQRFRAPSRPLRAGAGSQYGIMRGFSPERFFSTKGEFSYGRSLKTAVGTNLTSGEWVGLRGKLAENFIDFSSSKGVKLDDSFSEEAAFKDPSLTAVTSVLRDPTGLVREFVVPQIRYRPGGHTYWRLYRAQLRRNLGLRVRRQWRLSRVIAKMSNLRCYSFIRYLTSSLSWCVGSFTSMKFSVTSSAVQVSSGLWAVNGVRCSNPFFQLYVGDVISPSASSATLWPSASRLPLPTRANLSVPGEFSTHSLADFPWHGTDSPVGLEVDELSRVIIVIADPFIGDNAFMSHETIPHVSVRLYNWKYVV